MSSPGRVSVGLAFLLISSVFLVSACGRRPGTEVENLRAFAKLYGYVRFFHPSDEAATVDWERFAVLGVTRVRNAASADELEQTLVGLFQPVASTLQIYRTGESIRSMPLTLEDTAGFEIVAWQHFGVGLGHQGSIYRSKRLNRVAEVAGQGAGFGTVTQGTAADAYRGKRIKLTAFVRADVAGVGNQGQMWLRVDRPNGQMGFFDNMGDRPITSSEWQRYEIEGNVAEDATAIFFGCFLLGKGRLWVDDFELHAAENGAWEPIEINNPGFEEGELGEAPPMWFAESSGYRYQLTADNPYSGARAVSIEDARMTLTGPLFSAHTAVGEVIEKPIGSGLSVRIPLALHSVGGMTVPHADTSSLTQLHADLDAIDLGSATADDEAVRLADVVIAWNVFQHFYPYFDVVDVDWDSQLTRSLERALADEDGSDFYLTLSALVANLHDGHGNVFHPEYRPQGRLPVLVDWVEGQVVVTVSEDSSLQRGDIIERLDGIAAEEALLEAEQYISGSPQWRRWRALAAFGAGDVGAKAALTLRRGATSLEFEVERRQFEQPLSEPRPENIELLEEGIYYVNLDRTPMPKIQEKLEALASAEGVIFDLRGYPNGNHQVISHLLTVPDTSGAWMRVPQIIYPDREEPIGYRDSGWRLPALEPHIDGKVVFITDGRAISYAESFMGFIEGYGLAEIVGQPTAGTNGNVNPLTLPGGFRITWTGMKVMKHDGSQHHLIGIRPTIPAERTIEGVRQGVDEFLETALEVIRRQ